MRLLVVRMGFLACSAAVLLAQRKGGYGAVSISGRGWHAAAHGPNALNGRRASHPDRWGTTVVLYPIYVGGIYGIPSYGYALGSNSPDQEPGAAATNAGGPPALATNQNFVPGQSYPSFQNYADRGDQASRQAGAGVYRPPLNADVDQPWAATQQFSPAQLPSQQPQAAASNDGDQVTFYLIAFTDHNVVPVVGFSAQHNSLRYVGLENSVHQVSLNLVDRDLSQRLNEERGVEFKLPSQ